MTRLPLIAHVIFALKIGGLENGLVNLINRMPRKRYRHAVICLTDHDDFARRLDDDTVIIRDMRQRSGIDPGLYARLWRVFREMRPDIVHTRNLAAVEAQLPAALAGVRARVHGEHGRGVQDPDGTVRKYQRLRRAMRPLIHHYIPLSRDLERYLVERIGVDRRRITRIRNGVDTDRFSPRAGGRNGPLSERFGRETIIVGAVGRMGAEKDPLNLIQAFMGLVRERPEWRERIRLVWIGGGPLYEEVKSTLARAGVADLAWLPGPREDVAELLADLDIYVLPSLTEGISNTLLEAMAVALPQVATRVGGNEELVVDGETGVLVARQDPAALADAIARYAESPDLRLRHGQAARTRAKSEFSLSHMTEQYVEVYDRLLGRVANLQAERGPFDYPESG